MRRDSRCIDWLELQLSSLQCLEAAFDDHQAFVIGGGIFRGERVIIGLNDPLAIIGAAPLIAFVSSRTSSRSVALGTLGSEQVNRPLRGCLLILIPR